MGPPQVSPHVPGLPPQGGLLKALWSDAWTSSSEFLLYQTLDYKVVCRKHGGFILSWNETWRRLKFLTWTSNFLPTRTGHFTVVTSHQWPHEAADWESSAFPSSVSMVVLRTGNLFLWPVQNSHTETFLPLQQQQAVVLVFCRKLSAMLGLLEFLPWGSLYGCLHELISWKAPRTF